MQCGVIQCGAVRCGEVWCGAVKCGAVRCDMSVEDVSVEVGELIGYEKIYSASRVNKAVVVFVTDRILVSG